MFVVTIIIRTDGGLLLTIKQPPEVTLSSTKLQIARITSTSTQCTCSDAQRFPWRWSSSYSLFHLGFPEAAKRKTPRFRQDSLFRFCTAKCLPLNMTSEKSHQTQSQPPSSSVAAVPASRWLVCQLSCSSQPRTVSVCCPGECSGSAPRSPAPSSASSLCRDKNAHRSLSTQVQI